MARAFVVQAINRWDPGSRSFVPKYPSVERAAEFGELVYLLGPRATPFRPEDVIPELERKLADFDPDEDSIVLIGNPVLIAWTGAVASRVAAGRVTYLQWSGRETRYVKIEGVLPGHDSVG